MFSVCSFPWISLTVGRGGAGGEEGWRQKGWLCAGVNEAYRGRGLRFACKTSPQPKNECYFYAEGILKGR